MRVLQLTVLSGEMAICRLAPSEPPPEWAEGGPFGSITRTEDELSVVCRDANVPEDVRADREWKCLRIEGPFAFDETGIAAAVAVPLAKAEIGIFIVSTFDTDYILVKRSNLEGAVKALREAGHEVRRIEN